MELVIEEDAELVDVTDEPDEVDDPGLVTPELVEPELVEPELVTGRC